MAMAERISCPNAGIFKRDKSLDQDLDGKDGQRWCLAATDLQMMDTALLLQAWKCHMLHLAFL
jgi:hypothetical protein